jgi:hypothetical protein
MRLCPTKHNVHGERDSVQRSKVWLGNKTCAAELTVLQNQEYLLSKFLSKNRFTAFLDLLPEQYCDFQNNTFNDERQYS